jgi:hypothetical protein
MTKNHNKKRNIGIIYEMIMRSIASSLISGDKERAQTALNIIENRFNKSSEIYKEFRLFNALAKSQVSETSVAAGILSEARSAARRCDPKALDREKSSLISDINKRLNDKNFYYRRIPEYKVYATIQTLLNGWRQNDSADLSRVVMYESRVIDWLLKEKEEISDLENHVNEDVDTLVVNIMKEKLNERYSGSLNLEQKDILRTYVFSIHEGDHSALIEKLKKIKNDTSKEMLSLSEQTENETLLEKIERVKFAIERLEPDQVTDLSVSRFLTVSQLKSEILNFENGDKK